MQERPSVKKLLAYEKEVAEQFAPGAGSVALFIYASLTLPHLTLLSHFLRRL
jgi:hypothetical protein